MSDQPMIEVWGAGTMRTLRPLWVLEELGLPYHLAPIGPRTGETQTLEYTELNPKQKIPFLKDGSVKLSESVAMSRYLIERYGHEESLSIPATIEARAKEDEWVCYVYGELDETSLYVMRRHRDLHTIYGVEKMRWIQQRPMPKSILQSLMVLLQTKNFCSRTDLGLPTSFWSRVLIGQKRTGLIYRRTSSAIGTDSLRDPRTSERMRGTMAIDKPGMLKAGAFKRRQGWVR